MSQNIPGGMPPSYVPYGMHQPQGQPPRTGLLLAAGVIAIVESAFLLLVGALALVATNGGRGDGMFDDLVAGIGVVFAILGAAWLAAGIGGVLRRMWGKVLLIVGNSLVVLLALASSERSNSGALVLLVPAAIGLGLAIAGQPRRPG